MVDPLFPVTMQPKEPRLPEVVASRAVHGMPADQRNAGIDLAIKAMGLSSVPHRV
jgi:hypothetical protein